MPSDMSWARLMDKKSGLAFYLYNTHLDHKSQTSREKSVRLIMAHIQERKHQAPFVLTGDFNAGENNLVIKYFKGTIPSKEHDHISLVDAFRVLYPVTKEVGTFNGFQGRKNGTKIDYIFITPSTRTLNASIIRTKKGGRYPSDHFPVFARIRFKTKLRASNKRAIKRLLKSPTSADLDEFDRLTSELLNEWKCLGRGNRLKILQYIEKIKTPEEIKRQQIEQSKK